MSELLVQEAGADVAASMLRRYNPDTREWNFAKDGEFWDAVDLAHGMGRTGKGRRIAVIDDGFDMSLPALAEHRLGWDQPAGEAVAHGSCVALLILEAAPGARLVLFPTAVHGSLSSELVERAIREATAAGADIINISLGESHPSDAVLEVETLLDAVPRWDDREPEDHVFWVFDQLRQIDGWRYMVRMPSSTLADAARDAAQAGIAVVAAAGNARERVFVPASAPDVLSVSFMRSVRTVIDGLAEEVTARSPSFSQSEFSDFSLLQPPGVLGSSFATPLLSGFAALMSDRSDLLDYREMAWLDGMAARLLAVLGKDPTGGPERRRKVVEALYKDALQRSPHRHDPAGPDRPCPECSLFATPTYVNFGYYLLNWRALDGAELLLTQAWLFAPRNPHAAANLGVLRAMRAQVAQQDNRWDDVVTLLRLAQEAMTRAVELRPDHVHYQRRLAEFTTALTDPRRWQLVD